MSSCIAIMINSSLSHYRFGNLLVTDRGVMALVVEAVLDALNGKHGKEISLVDLTKKVRS